MNSFHQYQHAQSHSHETDGLHPDATKARDCPDPNQKTEKEEQVDRSASPGRNKIVGDETTCST